MRLKRLRKHLNSGVLDPCSGQSTPGGLACPTPEDLACPLPSSFAEAKAAAELDGLCSYPPPATPRVGSGAMKGEAAAASGGALWRKGDSVELIVNLGDAVCQPQMILKVWGMEEYGGVWRSMEEYEGVCYVDCTGYRKG